MEFLDELRAAVSSYPTESVILSIVDAMDPVEFKTGELFQFYVRLTNNGELSMKNASVRIQGSAFADVAKWELPLTFGANVSSPGQDVPAHDPRKFGPFLAHAKSETQTLVETLFKATVGTWDASFEDLLKHHSASSAVPAAVYRAKVAPY